MDHINFTVKRQGSGLQLSNGTPRDNGLDAPAGHMLLTFSYVEVMLWLVNKLNQDEKEKLVQGVLTYLDETTHIPN